MVTHKFKDMCYGICHTFDKDCKCKPVRQSKPIRVSSGRGGRHQGYRYEITFLHNVL